MPDAADDACIHPYGVIVHNDQQSRVEWACGDCGRVFSWLADDAAMRADQFTAWADRIGIGTFKAARWWAENVAPAR